MFVKKILAGVGSLGAALALTASPVYADVILDTGMPTGTPNWSLGAFQYFGAEFTTTGANTINSIEAAFGVISGGNMGIALHADGGNIPGSILYSTTVGFGSSGLSWQGAFGLNWAIGPGNYWVSFTPDGSLQGVMPGVAPLPASEYAQGGYGVWSDCGVNCRDYLDIGVRIMGNETSVPEPLSLTLLGISLAGLGLNRRRSAR